jgi:ribosome maturation factor RimP
MKTLADIRPLIDDKLNFMRLSVYDVKFISAGKRSVLRVYIDKPGGVTIDDCEKASNAISVLLDLENFSNTPYSLEVSSPGLDRVLRGEKDFRMVIGYHVVLRVKDTEKPEIIRDQSGKLSACDHTTLTLELDDEQTMSIPLSNIVNGKIDISFQ